MVLYYLIKRKNRIPLTIAAVAAAVLLNGLFNEINNALSLPIFLDSVFTVSTAALFGLWPSIAVGALTNLFIELLNGFPGHFLPFSPVNILTALTTSLFIYRKRFETPTNAFWLILLLTFVNALAGSFIVTLLFEGYTDLSLDYIVRSFALTGKSLFTSTFIVRLVVNIVDKGIAVLIAFFLYKYIQTRKAA